MDKPGICPKCGGKLEYRSHLTFFDEKIDKWMCRKCGAWGREAYDIVFRGHENVDEFTKEMRKRKEKEYR